MNRLRLSPVLTMALLGAGLVNQGSASAASCESLGSLMLSQARITLAQSVPAGSFQPPATSGGTRPAALTDLPAFCRVTATLMPTSDSAIKIEVWMPASGWNRRFHGVGNGGFGGTITYGAMADALRRKDATASSDTGHDTPGGSFGMGHPEKIADWAYRSTHVMTEAAKTIVKALYDNGPDRSYLTGCSTGGHQGLSEAERYPADYDGILVGDHGANRTRIHASFMWTYAAARRDPVSTIPPAKLPVIHDAVLAACDLLDGVKDGFLTDPRRCQFDPAKLLCKSGDGPDCLTAPQIDTVKKVYDGMRNPRTKELIYPGWTKGSEVTRGGIWTDMALQEPSFEDLFRYWIFEDPNWDWRHFDFDHDMEKTDSKIGAVANALSTDMKAFQSRGGKIIMYHGFDDTRVAPADSINYYERAVAAIGGKGTQDSIRLFMVPGMAHCNGGPGPTTFDALSALEEWVEHAVTPQRIIGSHLTDGAVTMTRPLCPYPQEAVYLGRGNTNDAASFACRVVK